MVQLDTLANIATIFLIIEALVVLVVLLAVSFGLARATMLVRRKVVQIMPQIQGQARRLAGTTETVSQKVAAPFIRFETSQARFRGMSQRAFYGGKAQSGHQHSEPKEE
jgi:hypothetical protein